MSSIEPTHISFEAIGTHWDIQLPEPVQAPLEQAIRQRIGVFDKQYSRFRNDSLVTQIAQNAGTYPLPPDGFKLLATYQWLYQATDGRVTPLIGQVVSDAGYDATYSFVSNTLQQPPRWEDVVSFTEQTITVTEPVLLDFGAAGKGYLVDIISQLMQESGCQNYLINAGGDILHRARDQSAVQVGLENPHNPSEVIGAVRLSNQSLCASSGSKRKWGSFTHIIDPVKLQSPIDILATWVLAEDTITADGLATALFFQTPEKLREQFSFSYAILTTDMELSYSHDFPVEPYTGEAA